MGDETKNPVPKKEETQDLNSKWIELGFEAVKNSVDNIKSTADKIITLDTGLITIYTGALAFLNKQEYLNFYMSHIISGIIIVIPILLWIVSIYYSIEAYSTKKRFLKLDDPINIENNGSVETLLKSISLARNVCYGTIYTDTFRKNVNLISSSKIDDFYRARITTN